MGIDCPGQSGTGQIDDMMDIDERDFDAKSNEADGMEIAHNVSMDDDARSTPKKHRNSGPIFDETEFGPNGHSTPPRRQGTVLAQGGIIAQINNHRKQMTKSEHAKLLREKRQAQFVEKRDQANQKRQAHISFNGMKGSLRGQLGQPFRQFSDASGHLQKLRSNFDQIMAGQLSVTEVYE